MSWKNIPYRYRGAEVGAVVGATFGCFSKNIGALSLPRDLPM